MIINDAYRMNESSLSLPLQPEQQQEDKEPIPLLKNFSSSTALSSFDLFNDLTYSDDEYDDWDMAELGAGGSSSPEGEEADTPDGIQALFSSCQPQDLLLVHPLAQGDCHMSDEGSYLAFSLSSIPGEEERMANSYGSLEPFDYLKNKAAVSFRHVSLGFDNISKSKPKQLQWQQVEHQHQLVQKNATRSNAETYVTNASSRQRMDHYPATPLPKAIAEESPNTSATTDITISPITATDIHTHPNKKRITQLLSEETKKKLRRQKRLKKIKKAAESKEAAVQKVRGIKQTSPHFNDAIFAVFFLLQFSLVTLGAIVLGPGALRDKMYGTLERKDGQGFEMEDYNPFAGLQSDDVIIALKTSIGIGSGENEEVVSMDESIPWISHIDYVNVIQLVCIVSGYASLCSLLALGFMMMLSKNLIHTMLIFTIFVSMAWTIMGFSSSSYSMIIPSIGMLALVLSFAYTVVVWDRIPFASRNLSVALKGMRSTLDIPLLGACVLLVSFLWTIWWICSFVGVFDFLNDDNQVSNNWIFVVFVFYLFSYYWTIQVIRGVAQATVASIVGHWWNDEEFLPICGGELRTSLYRNLTNCFGSICLGALVLDPCILFQRGSNFLHLAIPRLRSLINLMNLDFGSDVTSNEKSHSSNKNRSCSFTDNAIHRNVNQWSYSYIGLYGYKFWDSGHKASQLFEARGWTHVVSDDLILTALSMSSMVIGGSTACLGLIVEEVDGFSFTTLNKPVVTAFLIGLFVGLVLSAAFLSIIEGSVSAILVCYASAPVDFHANHYHLSEELKSVWKEFWFPR